MQFTSINIWCGHLYPLPNYSQIFYLDLFSQNFLPCLDASSNSFKEQNAHVASVKNILESHASYLMSGKELSKLVAFVKGTQFDLVVSGNQLFVSNVFFVPMLYYLRLNV